VTISGFQGPFNHNHTLNFQSFNLHDDLLEGVMSMGYQQPTPIQEQAIPLILENKDLIACAQTGTGKTAAYLIPLLNKISHSQHDHTSTLILVPTRELAKQIDEQVEGFAYFVPAQSIAIYGGGKGDNWDTQKTALTSGADIIVATPGRLIAHLNMGYVNFDRLEYLVLDEADKMLDMGFMDDLLKIIRFLPPKRQTLMFSATMPPKIRDLAKKILVEPAEISLAISKPAAGIDQRLYLAYDNQKPRLLEHLIQELDVQSMIIFTSRKSGVGDIVRVLKKMGHDARGIMSDLTQDEREKVLQGFRNKQFSILVATDIVSRGIDIENISHIVNYDVPQDAEDYVHRVGRTARAATTGIAITFVNEKDQDRVVKIERLIERELPKLPLPDDLGSAPEWSPEKSRGFVRHGRHNQGSGGSFDRRSGGGKSSGRAGGGGGHRRPEGSASGTRNSQPSSGAAENQRPKENANRRNRNNRGRRPSDGQGPRNQGEGGGGGERQPRPASE
jgi:ATP-dependent RNA helicase RhlE